MFTLLLSSLSTAVSENVFPRVFTVNYSDIMASMATNVLVSFFVRLDFNFLFLFLWTVLLVWNCLNDAGISISAWVQQFSWTCFLFGPSHLLSTKSVPARFWIRISLPDSRHYCGARYVMELTSLYCNGSVCRMTGNWINRHSCGCIQLFYDGNWQSNVLVFKLHGHMSLWLCNVGVCLRMTGYKRYRGCFGSTLR